MFSKGLGNDQTEKNVSNSEQGTSSLHADFTNSIRTLINSVAFHKKTKYPEQSAAYHSCTSLPDHLKSILRADCFPKALCFSFVLSSQNSARAISWGICSDCSKHLFSLQNDPFFWNCICRKSSGIFCLAKAVFFKDLHWIKMIKLFDFSEAKVGTV